MNNSVERLVTVPNKVHDLLPFSPFWCCREHLKLLKFWVAFKLNISLRSMFTWKSLNRCWMGFLPWFVNALSFDEVYIYDDVILFVFVCTVKLHVYGLTEEMFSFLDLWIRRFVRCWFSSPHSHTQKGMLPPCF